MWRMIEREGLKERDRDRAGETRKESGPDMWRLN